VLGALPVLLIRDLSPRPQDMFLGFAAGVMLAASFLSLIIPGVERASGPAGNRARGALAVAAAMLLGAAGLWLPNRHAPHQHSVKLLPAHAG
jgi:zinc transporter, ZIP family